MYYLDEKQFKPMLIILSVIFLPFIVLLGIIMFLDFELIILVIELSILIIYIMLIFILRKDSKSKGNYLIIHDEMFEIYYPNIGEGTHKLKINFCDIIEIKYYKITSIRGWLQILGYVVPKCTYITYKKYGKKITELMGFFDLNDIREITNKKGIKLIIK